MRRLLALLLLGPVVLLGCGSDNVDVGTEGTTGGTLPAIPPQGAPEQDRLDAALARWDASDIEDYEWSYTLGCFCPPLTVSIDVEDGVAVRHELEPDETGATVPDQTVRILTMPDLFDVVQEQVDTADSFTVVYEPETGRVISLDADPMEDATDDELSYAVESFVAAGQPSAEAFDPAVLTEAWACGRSFQASNPAQTISLRLELTDPSYEALPPQTATLPDSRWDGRIEMGADLFSNWCDDVITPDEPQPRVDETWPIVAGSITVTPEVTSASPPSGPVVAHLTGLVAEKPDGTRVEIGDLDVTNTLWGGAAG